ncbi:ionotropic receptor 75a-like [Phlebotomus papatasi]|uniref:ionotropic receptor 75a-like n=1 Tax=Phlebotomus papatasi TaxID=29031 RepID=UPI00248428FA|nr:ionotropic receptor 75a-like [Phlebotomus papatasi]
MFVFQSSRDSAFDPSAFVDPFTTSVWICLILFLIVFSLALKAVFKCERILQQRSFCPSISLTSIMSFGALCQQGTSIVPQTIPGKCVHVIMYFTCLLLHHYYASEAVSSLIDIPLKSSIRNIRNLADSSMNIGMDESLPWIRNLGESEDPEIRYFWVKRVLPLKNPENVFINAGNGINKSKDIQYAFLGESSITYNLIKKFYSPEQICNFNELNLQPVTFIGLFVEKKSQFREILRRRLTRMREVGVYSRIKGQIISEKPQCLSNPVTSRVGLDETALLFTFLAISAALCLIILIIEITWDRMKITNA